MGLNSGALNSHALNAAADAPHFIGVLSDAHPVGIEQVILSTAEKITVGFFQEIFDTGVVTVNIQSQITETIYKVSTGIQQQIFETGVVSSNIRQVVFGTSDGTGVTPVGTVIPAGLNSPSDESSYWTAKVLLAGVDVSANLTGSIRVDLEESAARVCSFTVNPTAGPVDLTSWVNAEVFMFYTKTTSAGVVLAEYMLFKGNVDVPEYDPDTRLTTFSCTDGLQKTFEAQTRQQIDAVIGGFWSAQVFEQDTDKWSYAQDRLSTIPYSLNYDVNKQLVKTPWLGKVTEDFLLNASVILDNSLSVSLANSRSIINKVELDIGYQYDSYKERQVNYTWKMDPSVESGEYWAYGFTPVRVTQVTEAATADGWAFTELPSLTPWPPNGFYAGVVSINNDHEIVTGASFKVGKRYSQSVREGYNVVLKSPKSIASIGQLVSKEEFNISVEYSQDVEDFQNTDTKAATFIARQRALAGGGIVTRIDQPFTYEGFTHNYPSTIVNGEVQYDMSSLVVANTRADFEQSATVVKNLHKTSMLASHRQNSVSCRTLIEPNITTESTVRVDTFAVKAKGKVRQVTHTMNIDEGSAITDVVIGVSRSTGVGIPDVETALPDVTVALDTLLPPTDSNGAINNYVILGNYVQADPNSVQIGRNATGMQAYYTATGTDFVVNFPEISQENVDLIDSNTQQEFIVDIPDEELTINA